ncbi:MAG: hypothetical protein V3S46_09475 [Nitrospinota bacterium]
MNAKCAFGLFFPLIFALAPLAAAQSVDAKKGRVGVYDQERRPGMYRQEGGCSFSMSDTYQQLGTHFAEFSENEKKMIKEPHGLKEVPEALIFGLMSEIKFAVGTYTAGSGGTDALWDEPKKLLTGDLPFKVSPAIAAGFKKGGECANCDKIHFIIGEEGRVTSGYLFLAENAVHLIVEKINGMPREKITENGKVKGWKLFVEEPVRFKEDSNTKMKEKIPNWVYLPFTEN